MLCACIFNEHQAVGLFLAFDGVSTRTDPFTSGNKYCKLVNNAVFIHNESLFFISVATTSAFQLEHTAWLLCSVCPGGYQIQTIDYGKILVMLFKGEYYGRVYEVYNKYIYMKNLQFNSPVWVKNSYVERESGNKGLYTVAATAPRGILF